MLDRVKSISALSAHSAVKGLIGILLIDVVNWDIVFDVVKCTNKVILKET